MTDKFYTSVTDVWGSFYLFMQSIMQFMHKSVHFFYLFWAHLLFIVWLNIEIKPCW